MPREMQSIPAQAGAEALVALLDADGAAIVEDFLSPNVVGKLNAELDALFEAERGVERQFPNDQIAGFFGDKLDHISGVAGKSPTFVEEVLCHPLYMSVCDHVLLPNCADYQLNIAHVMERLPGSEAQFVHRDGWVWKRLPKMNGEVQLASVVALVDFSCDNGATVVVPGSHRWEEGRYPEPSDAVPAAMKAGSAVIYLGNTFHGGGANVTSDARRRGMHVSYCAGWLRTEENNCLSTPADVMRKMSPRAQELLGFGIHDDIAVGGGYLGTMELAEPRVEMGRTVR
ncbi:MAG: ectoine hydroxylase-related dioxygenase (phytanoyl-CoA dioxygenase family) [Myxococcota bacterium]|jgi:ectoine hydroxylase-related dioxygenase (phytanoyl-CoA dioxygenase family)